MPKRAYEYGGQAVIEGVMMRGPRWTAVAVRKPDGAISIRRTPTQTWTHRRPFSLPIVRGSVVLVQTLSLGIEALLYSANESSEEEEKVGKGEMGLAVAVAFAVALGIFVVGPTLAATFLRQNLGPIWANLVEGSMRLTLVLGYMAAVSRMKDVKRVLEYHGAEHKAINSWENLRQVSVENALSQSRTHKRCGTSFLLVVAATSIVIYSFFGWPNILARVVLRLLLLPLVAGISYEVIKISSRSEFPGATLLAKPGLWLQGFTTKEPDGSQVEVAVRALQDVLETEA